MLRGVVVGLAGRGHLVSVIARRHAPLSALARSHAGIHPMPCDYREAGVLAAAIRTGVSARGAFGLCLAWIHSPWEEPLGVIAGMIGVGRRDVRLIQVVGSAHADPAGADRSDVECERVILGFVVEGSRSRWLTHDEIAAGVMGAIDRPARSTIVGQVEPWGRRPGD